MLDVFQLFGCHRVRDCAEVSLADQWRFNERRMYTLELIERQVQRSDNTV